MVQTPPFIKEIKEKANKLNFIKFNKFYSLKDIIN